MYSRLEEALIAVDVGGETAAALVERVRVRVGGRTERAAVEAALREELEVVLAGTGTPQPRGRPWVVLVTGVNGVGKTRQSESSRPCIGRRDGGVSWSRRTPSAPPRRGSSRYGQSGPGPI